MPRRMVQLAGSRTGVLALTTGGQLVVRTGSSMLLTRLLSPEAFGVVGIINSIFFAIGMLTDLGFQVFIIRHEKGEDPHFLNVIWTIHATRGIGLTLLAVALSPLVGVALGKPETVLPFAAASLIFALNGVTSLSLMTVLRQDGARKLSLFELGMQVFQTVVCVILALWWRSSWALIGAMVAQQGARAIASYVVFPGVRHRFARDAVISAEFLRFSRIVLATSALTLLLSQTDKIVLARIFTLSQFGLYAIALTLAGAPASFCDTYVTRVLYPVCARIWREAPEQLAQTFYQVRRSASLAYGFGCGGLIGGAPLLIAILYDPRYAASATYLSLLMISSALRFSTLSAADLMTAIGEIRVTFRCNVTRLAWLIVAGPIGYWAKGPLGLVAVVGLIEVPPLLYSWIVLRRFQLLRLPQELLFLATIAAGAVVGFAASHVMLGLFPNL